MEETWVMMDASQLLQDAVVRAELHELPPLAAFADSSEFLGSPREGRGPSCSLQLQRAEDSALVASVAPAPPVPLEPSGASPPQQQAQAAGQPPAAPEASPHSAGHEPSQKEDWVTQVDCHGKRCLATGFMSDSELISSSWGRQGRSRSPRRQPVDGTAASLQQQTLGGLPPSDSDLTGTTSTPPADLALEADERCPCLVAVASKRGRSGRKVQSGPPEDKEAASRASTRVASRGTHAVYLPLGLVLIGATLVACSLRAPVAVREDTSPATVMARHSANLLHQIQGSDSASLRVLQDKLELKQMQVELDTQVFTAPRKRLKAIVKGVCNLPEKICNSMMVAASTSEMMYHKKSSNPLDSNQGAYYAVWMWVKAVGHSDDVEIAYKAASLSYQLRDVVTYKEQITEEPVIRCETTTISNIFGHQTKEHCREVSKLRTVTPLPVFRQSTMSPEEMQLVDTLMETMLAKKALENADVRNVPIPSLAVVGRPTF